MLIIFSLSLMLIILFDTIEVYVMLSYCTNNMFRYDYYLWYILSSLLLFLLLLERLTLVYSLLLFLGMNRLCMCILVM